MSRARKVLLVLVVLLVVLVGAVAGFLAWAKSAREARMSRTFTTHTVDFAVPFPLSEAEVEALRAEKKAALPPEADPATDVLAGVDLAAIATERAVKRGEHLVTARYVCVECHGRDFSGGIMIHDEKVGIVHGPNVTGGAGSRVGTFTLADWDRIVRHGVRVDGTAAVMPAMDFFEMSDHELSDIIAYVRSLPKVDKPSVPLEFGPILNVMVALGKFRISAVAHPDHQRAHAVEPPAETDALAFGKHLTQTCAGCHGLDFKGGPIPGAPPEWAPAANLAPTADGPTGYSYAQFLELMRTGKKRDGSSALMPMSLVPSAGKLMAENELQAIYGYLKTLPPAP